MRILLGAALIAMQFGFWLPAQAMTSEQLVGACKNSQQKLAQDAKREDAIRKLLDTGTCAGFIGGAVSGINVVGSLMKQQGVTKRDLICLPTDISPPQLVNMFVKHIDSHPEEKQLPAQLGIYRYFVSNFPCKE